MKKTMLVLAAGLLASASVATAAEIWDGEFTGDAHSGDYAARFQYTTPWAGGVDIALWTYPGLITVTEGAMEVKFWARADDGTGSTLSLSAWVRDSGYANIATPSASPFDGNAGDVSPGLTVTDSWQEFTWSFSAPATSDHMIVLFKTVETGADAPCLWVDDISVWDDGVEVTTHGNFGFEDWADPAAAPANYSMRTEGGDGTVWRVTADTAVADWMMMD